MEQETFIELCLNKTNIEAEEARAKKQRQPGGDQLCSAMEPSCKIEEALSNKNGFSYWGGFHVYFCCSMAGCCYRLFWRRGSIHIDFMGLW